jgi:hypothetical protein
VHTTPAFSSPGIVFTIASCQSAWLSNPQRASARRERKQSATLPTAQKAPAGQTVPEVVKVALRGACLHVQREAHGDAVWVDEVRVRALGLEPDEVRASREAHHLGVDARTVARALERAWGRARPGEELLTRL